MPLFSSDKSSPLRRTPHYPVDEPVRPTQPKPQSRTRTNPRRRTRKSARYEVLWQVIFWTSVLVATLLVMVVVPGRDGSPAAAPEWRRFMIVPGLGFLAVAPWAWGKGGARLAGAIAAGGLGLLGGGVEQAFSSTFGRLLLLPMAVGFAAYAVWLASPAGQGEDKRWGAFSGAVLFAVGATAYAFGAL